LQWRKEEEEEEKEEGKGWRAEVRGPVMLFLFLGGVLVEGRWRFLFSTCATFLFAFLRFWREKAISPQADIW